MSCSKLLWQMIKSKSVFFQASMESKLFPAGLYRRVYEVIKNLYERGAFVDSSSVADSLPEDLKLRLFDEIVDAVPTTSNWKFYRDAVWDEWRKNRVEALLEEAKDRLDSEDVIDWITTELTQLSGNSGGNVRSNAASIVGYVNELEARHKMGGILPGLETGIEPLDEVILGLRKRRFYLIGARPSEGKTALMTTMIAHIARKGIPVGVISLESSEQELTERFMANVGNIDNIKLARGAFTASDFADITTGAEILGGAKWNVRISDSPYLGLPGVTARIREMVIAHKCEAIFLDYIQLVAHVDKALTFRLHINAVSQMLKALARELNVPVVACAQLGRDSEGKRPHLSGFKESGQLEQDADVAILIWNNLEDGNSYLLVDKNRDGPKQAVNVKFILPKMRFVGGQ